jgi:cytochrome c oxidase subunit 6c
MCATNLNLSLFVPSSIPSIGFIMSGVGAVAKIAKPVMRGMIVTDVKKNLVQATVLSTIVAGAFWYFVARERKINYAEFYKTYDAEKDYQGRMRII